MPKKNHEQVLSPIEVELQEYKLTEKVQERILSRAKFIFAVFIAGFTLLGFFGGSYLIDYTSRQVEQKIHKKMEKDTEILTKRLQESLADLKLSTTEILKESEDAREQLQKLKDSYKELQDLNTRYSSLYTKVEDLHKNVERTSTKLATTKEDTESFKQAVIKTAIGIPSILASDVSVHDDVIRVELKGAHLGDSPADVKFEIFTPDVGSGAATIHRKDIEFWNKNKIIFEYNIGKLLILTLKSQKRFRLKIVESS